MARTYWISSFHTCHISNVPWNGGAVQESFSRVHVLFFNHDFVVWEGFSACVWVCVFYPFVIFHPKLEKTFITRSDRFFWTSCMRGYLNRGYINIICFWLGHECLGKIRGLLWVEVFVRLQQVFPKSTMHSCVLFGSHRDDD